MFQHVLYTASSFTLQALINTLYTLNNTMIYTWYNQYNNFQKVHS